MSASASVSELKHASCHWITAVVFEPWPDNPFKCLHKYLSKCWSIATKTVLKESLLSLADNFTFKVCHLPLLVEQQYLHWYSSVTVLITVAVVTCLKTEIIALFSFVVFCRVLHNRCVVCMYVCALSLTWKFIVSQVNCSGSHGLECFVVSRFHGYRYWILIYDDSLVLFHFCLVHHSLWCFPFWMGTSCCFVQFIFSGFILSLLQGLRTWNMFSSS